MSITVEESHKEIKTILISQPQPKRSPYFNLEKKYGVKVDFRQFIHVEAVELKDFRKQRIKPSDFTAIILTSKNAVDHFFRLCEEMRIKMSQDTKYFCLTESIALYLQKFIVYRKRKVFYGKRFISDLKTPFMKYKGKEKFLMPCSNLGSQKVVKYLNENSIEYTESMMYQTVSSDLSDLSDITYDVLVFFSPLGIQSLFENFTDFSQKDTRIAAFGNSTAKAVTDKGLNINIKAPSKESPSMTMALENYLKKSNTPVKRFV